MTILNLYEKILFKEMGFMSGKLSLAEGVARFFFYVQYVIQIHLIV